MGLQFGEISAAEIQLLVNRGTPLPQDMLSKLAQKGQVETITSLVSAGLISDINMRNQVTGRNALSDAIVKICYSWYEYSPARAADVVDNFLSLGVQVTNSPGDWDALDYALDGISANNADVKLAIVRALLNRGLVLSDSQSELVSSYSGPPESYSPLIDKKK